MSRPFFAQAIQESSSLNSTQAAFKSLLVSYEIEVADEQLATLNEPDVDPQALSQIARLFGLEVAVQTVPLDYFGEQHLPAMVRFRSEENILRTVVIWDQIGPLFQVMDPQIGPRWLSQEKLHNELYLSESTYEAGAAWRHAMRAAEGAFDGFLESKLMALHIASEKAKQLIQSALADESWFSMAALDAAIRMSSQMVAAGALERGHEAQQMLERLFSQARSNDFSRSGPAAGTTEIIPEQYWAVLPVSSESQRVFVRGLKMLQVLGVKEGSRAERSTQELPVAQEKPADETLWHYLQQDGLFMPLILSLGAALTAGGVVLLVLLFYAFLQLDDFLASPADRLLAIALFLAFILSLPLLQWPTYLGALRLGRRLETRLRLAMLKKSARLPGSYFQKQSIADLTERIHSVAEVRYMPLLGLKVIQLSFEFILTLIAIAIIDSPSVPFILLALSGPLLWLAIGQPILSTRYRRLRAYIGRLSRFYLDGLLGLVAIRTHGAERSVAYEHESLLIQWARQKLSLHRIELLFASFDISLYWLALALLVLSYLARGQQLTILLLLLYWAFRLVYIIEELVPSYLEYFSQESKAQRFLEPLKAPDSRFAPSPPLAPSLKGGEGGVKIELRNVSVAQATLVLSNVDLTIEAGEHLAIVGSSGAGKSTLVGALLGWHQATGQILIDGQPFKESLLQLRRQTAWVDPAIQLWNQSVLKNLTYGTAKTPLSMVIEQADLINILERLPDGLNTRLGEGGRLVSGGQGQRVRFGRALGRKDARLVILDEPFRGLDREKREQLLARAREFWSNATIICVTHDVSLTDSFDRVLVVGEGRIIEADTPANLRADQGSHYQALLKAEQAVRQGLFSSTTWQRLWLEGGELSLPPEAIRETKGRVTPSSAMGARDEQSTESSTDDLPTWTLAHLDEAIRLLARKSGLPTKRSALLAPYREQAAEVWIENIMTQLELESQEVTYSYAEVEEMLKKGGPALLQLPNQRFIALLKGRKGWPYLSIIGPKGKIHRINIELVRNALCYPLEAPLEAEVERVLTQVEWPTEQRQKARHALLSSRLTPSESQIGKAWFLRISPKASLRDHIRQAKLPTYFLQIFSLRLLNRLLVFGSWGIMGYMVFLGHLQSALLLAWLLLILSIIPTVMLRMWIEKLFAVATGIVLRTQLFSGALNLSSDDIQTKGAGQFLGWVIDSEAMEEAILIETPGTIRAFVELLIAIILLFSSIPIAAFSLLGWLAFTAAMSWRFLQHEHRWKAHYSDMTNELVEKMIGHQTRLVQEKQSQWHENEDRILAHYEGLSKKRDQFEAWLVAFTPYGWLVVGLGGISYRFITQPEPITLAISVLAILTAFQALKDLALKLRGLVRATTSYQQIKPILQAANDTGERSPTQSLPLKKKNMEGKVILDARQLTFRYQPHHKPILQKCRLRIAEGDRLLLEGPSGGGKSTLAALLAGLRQPNSGMLLLHGLDWHTVGLENWRQRIVYAPQFHENHILSGTLAFNLLMGRHWPASEEDLADADVVCRELGLGILLDKMPLGLQQPVGEANGTLPSETGWHLSHGERSRIYIARALLQQAELVILDESFGALDPQNMEIALRTVLKRAPTLLVIAHP